MSLTLIDPAMLSPQAQYMGFKNRIINGAMMIDQRNAGASVAVTGNTGAMAVDRFELTVYGSATGRFSAQRSTNAPTGFINSLLVTVTTTDTSPSSAYAYGIGQSIEGLNVSDLGWGAAGAKPVAISFWAKSSLTGTFPVVLNAGDLTLAYGATYTISAANTWEYKTVLVTGPTSGGTTAFPVNNGIGFNVKWGLGGGSTRTIAAGSWVSVASVSTQLNVTGCTQLIATNGATLQITGAQLEVGSTATSFDYRPYGTELALCQRYFQVPLNQVGRLCNGFIYASNSAYGVLNFAVTMRAIPSITFSGLFYGTDASNTGRGMTAGTDAATTNNLSVNFTAGFNMNAGNATVLGLSSSGYVWASSEL